MRQLLLPTKIIESKNIFNEQILLKKRIPQVILYESDMLIAGKEKGYIILDFGQEMCGGIKFLTQKIDSIDGTAKIRVRFGESLSETCAELGEKNANNDHSVRDSIYTLTQLSDVCIGDTGYRFVRIDFFKGSNIEIKNIYAINHILRLPSIWRYYGEDKLVKKIFDVAKRTVDLCSHSGYIWDGIKRDRLVWAGDLYPEILSLTAMYGRVKCIENSLDMIRKSPKTDGKWVCGMPTYSAWWLCCVAEYYLQTKAEVFAKKQLEDVLYMVDVINQHVLKDGTLTYPEYFVDWDSRYSDDEMLGSKFITILALKKVREMFISLNVCCDKIDEALLNLSRGDLRVKEKKQVIGLKFVALGNMTDEEYDKLIKGGCSGFSTFMSYFILTAIASRNKRLAIDLMKEYYLGMLGRGATTFWEDFNINQTKNTNRIDEFSQNNERDVHGDFGNYCYKGFRHSLCHAWSSGVIKFIQENC